MAHGAMVGPCRRSGGEWKGGAIKRFVAWAGAMGRQDCWCRVV